MLIYVVLALMPYLYSLAQGLEYRGIYVTLLTACNIAFFAALLAQYPLAGRIKAVTKITGLDNGMQLHRKAGEYIALFFFLHPFLILAPRFVHVPQKTIDDVWSTLLRGKPLQVSLPGPL